MKNQTMRTKMKSSAVILAAAFIILLLNCESDQTEPDLTLVVGSWELTTVVSSSSCGLSEGTSKTEFIVLTDTGNPISIINFQGYWGTATLEGDRITFNGSEVSDDFGYPATLSTNGSGIVSGNTITGTFSTNVHFTDNESPEDCIIYTDFTMSRLDECDCYSRALFRDPEDSEYILPYPVGRSYPVYQSYCWPAGGHRNQLAVDFTVPIGDTVVAARGGIVTEIRESSPDDGEGEGMHNYIYILHEDGTLAFYAHLMQYSVIIEPDDTVQTGQYVALSGNSGYSGEPHLHFGVYQNYPPVEGEDVAVNFKNAEGPLDERGGLIRGEYYTALPY